ncbi:MAG: hypothetical protein H7224_05090 [Polaromonas sp.]|nr:hypothetical protein [Polaromonas sp.]
MNTRFFTAACSIASLFGLAAQAQTAATANPSGPQPLAFQSALEGYQSYTDDKLVDWKAANETTARIGGWRAYAKEASAPAVAPAPAPAPALAPTTAPAKP